MTAGNGALAPVLTDAPKPASQSKLTAATESFIQKPHFPTLIFQNDLQHCNDLNKTLLDLIYAERESGVTHNKSNTAELGSWHSATNLHKNPAYAAILAEITSTLARISDDLATRRSTPSRSRRCGRLSILLGTETAPIAIRTVSGAGCITSKRLRMPATSNLPIRARRS